MNCWTYKV